MSAPDGAEVGSIASWVQAGGLALFAGAVFTIVRDQSRVLSDIRTMIAVLVDRQKEKRDNVNQ